MGPQLTTFLRYRRVGCRELVAKVAQDNMVVVTWANYHFRDFVMNWVEHLRATGCTAFIVGALAACTVWGHHAAEAHSTVPWPDALTPTAALSAPGAMDDKLFEFLDGKGVPTFSMSSGLTLDDFGWGTPTFHKMASLGRL